MGLCSKESNPYQPPAFQSFAIADLPDQPIRDTPPSSFCIYDIIPTDDPEKNRIMVRMPLLENVLMDVTRMRHFNRSPNYEARALIVIREMVRKGHCKEVRECDMAGSIRVHPAFEMQQRHEELSPQGYYYTLRNLSLARGDTLH
jgi:hypothetical protein